MTKLYLDDTPVQTYDFRHKASPQPDVTPRMENEAGRMSVIENRQFPRLKPPKTVLAAWRSGMQRDVSYVESIGLGGLFLRTKKKVAIRSLVQILLDMPLGQVRGRGVVRRHQDHYGIAVQFIAMDPEDRGRLVRQLRELSPSEA